MSKNQKKELSAVQKYAADKATEKVNQAQEELRAILREIAKEQGINLDDPQERWKSTSDNKFLIKQNTPQLNIPKDKKKSEK